MSGESLSLGDAALDAEHDGFLALTESLLAAEPQDALQALVALRVHVREHFAHEDRDLRLHGGANASCHLDEHVAVLTSIDMVQARLAEAPRDPKALYLAERLAVELLRWLPVHVHEMDTALAKTRVQARFGAQPLRFAARPHQPV